MSLKNILKKINAVMLGLDKSGKTALLYKQFTKNHKKRFQPLVSTLRPLKAKIYRLPQRTQTDKIRLALFGALTLKISNYCSL
ncbi:ARF/SAR type [Hexamita inflata]|uniref:ARF/SAR type n=1 Tax=Hexamita inflata TaxID=28002 RepID=A0AA86TP24_9EUKA|nr:ARF/SAR type [Hexamita inflata]